MAETLCHLATRVSARHLCSLPSHILSSCAHYDYMCLYACLPALKLDRYALFYTSLPIALSKCIPCFEPMFICLLLPIFSLTITYIYPMFYLCLCLVRSCLFVTFTSFQPIIYPFCESLSVVLTRVYTSLLLLIICFLLVFIRVVPLF